MDTWLLLLEEEVLKKDGASEEEVSQCNLNNVTATGNFLSSMTLNPIYIISAALILPPKYGNEHTTSRQTCQTNMILDCVLVSSTPVPSHCSLRVSEDTQDGTGIRGSESSGDHGPRGEFSKYDSLPQNSVSFIISIEKHIKPVEHDGALYDRQFLEPQSSCSVWFYHFCPGGLLAAAAAPAEVAIAFIPLCDDKANLVVLQGWSYMVGMNTIVKHHYKKRLQVKNRRHSIESSDAKGLLDTLNEKFCGKPTGNLEMRNIHEMDEFIGCICE
ncbi:hypothetical protein MJG53_008631 [Ovis ammon polii x Ovis aries]|uniref:Uncharacterized protein n=1 Tax=Ovis ammon polii x Ovis aries TaxID=2918886 RepID=A0ACB9V166_9CETA|nr:hypothetical protein MJG53_008631 [Ovis ammon polii x Ovis aries]